MVSRVAWMCVCMLVPSAAAAQAREARPLRARNVIAWQPLSLITGYVDVEYERAFGRSASAYVAPGAIFAHVQRLDGTRSTELYAWSVDAGGRWYPRHDAPAGAFADASVGVFTSELDDTGSNRTRGIGFRAMILGGYTHIAWNHLVLSGGLGVQLRVFRADDANEYAVHVDPALRMAIGFAL